MSASVVSTSGETNDSYEDDDDFLFDDSDDFNVDCDSDKDEESGKDVHIKSYQVGITFDRRRIMSCKCTCNSRAVWCSHVVAVCLYRIHQVLLIL